VVLTAVFLTMIMGATAKKAAPATGGLVISLALNLIHLVSIPVTNTNINPARSTSQAIFAGGDQLGQLRLFIDCTDHRRRHRRSDPPLRDRGS
jgi:aquaporin Z